MKIVIPENISEITLSQYQEYDKLMQRVDLDEFDLKQRKVKIFTGWQFNHISAMSLNDLDSVLTLIDTALNADVKFSNRFKIGKTEFGFIPNFDDIKAKEYFDLSEYNGKIESLHKLMAVLFRPIVGSDLLGNYKIMEYQGTDEWAEVMKQTPLHIVNGALGFFLDLSNQLGIHIQRYLIQEQAKAAQRQATLKSGGGMQLSTS